MRTKLSSGSKQVSTGNFSVRADGTVLDSGRPYFPFGFYIVVQAPGGTDDIRNQYVTELGNAGFNFIYISYIDGLSSGSIFDNANNKSMKIVYQMTSWAGTWTDYANAYGQKIAWLGCFTGDDINLPCGNPNITPSAHLTDSQNISSAVPSRLLTVGNYVGDDGCAIINYMGSDDVMVHYSYPIDNWRPFNEELEQGAAGNKYVYDQMKASGKQNISLWTAWQTFKWDNGAYPTRSELRNLLYSAIVYGCKGVASYAYAHNSGGAGGTYLPTDAPDNWDEAQIINNEISQIAPAILDGTQTIINTGSAYGNFYHVAVWQYNNESYVIFVNTYRPGNRSLSITLPSSVSGTLTAVFAGRPTGMTFNNSTKVLSGSVAAETVHVYKIS